MKIAIMQPYLFPYIGYWQLISVVDKFVIYDNVQYEKSGWMRRNRILVNGKDKLFCVPIAKGSDYADVRERKVADDYLTQIGKELRTIKASYCKKPYFEQIYPLVEQCFNYQSKNLFDYIYYSVNKVCEYLRIDTEIVISSTLEVDDSFRREYRVIETCKQLGADTYINPCGGMSLYSKEQFAESGIRLQFLKSNLTPYHQGDMEFVPALSIIDMMMNISGEEIQYQLNDFILL